MSSLDVVKLRGQYGRALRAWHVAWLARVEWHHRHFANLDASTDGLLYDYVHSEREELRVAEEKAYDRFLAARDVLAEALRTLGGG